jgi:copper chaperone CopZ
MFNLFKKKPAGTTVTLKLSGLHCTSCPLNIDSELEELPGVIMTNTSYPKQQSVITYDPKLVDPSKFSEVIETLGYQVLK